MDVEELKALKVQWYENACKDGSIALCHLVGSQLGVSLSAKYGPKYKWEAEGVEIYVDDYGNYLTVHVDGKQVCCNHYCTRLFIPGPWMDVVKRAAVLARQKKEGDECRREQDECRRLLDELGISD